MLVALNFQEEVREALSEPADGCAGVVQPALGDEARYLRRGAAGERDEPLGVALQQLAVNAGLVVEPLQVRQGDQLYQVLVAGVALGQEGQVVGALVGWGLGVAALRRHIHLAADDGLDARGGALGVEVYGPVQVAVVGDGQSGHAQLFGSANELMDAAQAIEEAVLSVYVQVREHMGRLVGSRAILHPNR